MMIPFKFNSWLWFRKRSNFIIVTRKSVRSFKTCWILSFWQKNFVRCYYPIHLILGLRLLKQKGKYYKRSISIIKSPLTVYCISAMLQQTYVQFNSDLQIYVLLIELWQLPTRDLVRLSFLLILELCFYGCCHPSFYSN